MLYCHADATVGFAKAEIETIKLGDYNVSLVPRCSEWVWGKV